MYYTEYGRLLRGLVSVPERQVLLTFLCLIDSKSRANFHVGQTYRGTPAWPDTLKTG
jgi:hypothetical protein